MAEDQDNGASPNQRITVSLATLRQEIETALLRLQLELVKTYVTKPEMETLKRDVAEIKEYGSGGAQKAMEMVMELKREQDNHGTKIDELERDKAGRDAIDSFKKFWIGGGIITMIVMVANLVLNFYLISKGGHGGKP